MLTLYIGNHNVVELQTLTNVVSGAADTAATVEMTLKDRNGSEVAGQVWPATLAHDTGGTYRATLDFDLSIKPRKTYIAEISVTGTGGERAYWEVPVQAMSRNA